MAKLVLRRLTSDDEEAFFEGLREWENESLHWHTFVWKPEMSYAEMLSILEDEHQGRNLAPGRVPHTMLYAFLGKKIIGRLSIRHELNEYLLHRGGHIGYAVAPPYRRKGHAREILRQGLEACKELELSRLLVTCAEDNVPSRKLIERFGGQLENTVWDEKDQEAICRYWLELSK